MHLHVSATCSYQAFVAFLLAEPDRAYSSCLELFDFDSKQLESSLARATTSEYSNVAAATRLQTVLASREGPLRTA